MRDISTAKTPATAEKPALAIATARTPAKAETPEATGSQMQERRFVTQHSAAYTGKNPSSRRHASDITEIATERRINKASSKTSATSGSPATPAA